MFQDLSRLMIDIAPGEITMRDNRIDRLWRVRIAPFAMAKVPVTQELYRRVVGENPSIYRGEDHPVESVSWVEAVAFCNQLSAEEGFTPFYQISDDRLSASPILGSTGFRLPSEAEWEYACRAGTAGPRYGDLDAIAWFKDNSGGHTQPVGQKKPNAWGLYDMLGNVWEWCADRYDPKVYGAYRVFRGGGWADLERGCLATNRRRSHPTFQIDDLGFRIARDA